MKKLVLSFLFLLSALSTADAEKTLHIEYRPTPVDVDKPYFEPLRVMKSSWIQGAWYDRRNRYLIVRASSMNRQYCGVDEAVWDLFSASAPQGTIYSSVIKGNFDCRLTRAPRY